MFGAAELSNTISPPPSVPLRSVAVLNLTALPEPRRDCFESYYSGSCSVTLRREPKDAGMFWAIKPQLPHSFSEQDNHAQEKKFIRDQLRTNSLAQGVGEESDEGPAS